MSVNLVSIINDIIKRTEISDGDINSLNSVNDDIKILKLSKNKVLLKKNNKKYCLETTGQGVYAAGLAAILSHVTDDGTLTFMRVISWIESDDNDWYNPIRDKAFIPEKLISFKESIEASIKYLNLLLD